MLMTVEVQKILVEINFPLLFLNRYTLINIHTTMTMDIILTRD